MITVAKRWSDVARRPSGFDYLRILLAISVLLWHSYLVSYGKEAAINAWRGPIGIILELILPMFFCLSGFLVSGSLDRSSNIKDFLLLRAIRIYPALCVEVIISALILGPIVTRLPIKEYIFSNTLFEYILNIFGWIHYILPGVFEINPYPLIVNTSLRTVPYELECYLILPVLVGLGFLKSRNMSLLLFVLCSLFIAVALSLFRISGTPAGSINGRVLVLCFLAGVLIYRMRENLPYNSALGILSIGVGIILLRFDYVVFLAPIFVAYGTMWLGLQNPRRTLVIDSGDYSYGVYLYAAPIQQTVVHFLGSHNTWVSNVMLSLPVTVAFALFSWHAVEKPFIKIKKRIVRISMPANAVDPGQSPVPVR